jgi:hypothetical protein
MKSSSFDKVLAVNYLNLRCGRRFHPAWVNVDFTSHDQTALAHDLRTRIPFPDEQFEIFCHSYLL